MLAEKMMDYTSGGNVVPRNYLAGEAIMLSLNEDDAGTNFLLRQPDLKQLPIEADRDNKMLLIRNGEALGQYQILERKNLSTPYFAYSLNIDETESNLEQITTDDLDQLLGSERYQIARSTEELTRQVGLGRIGQEMFPIVLALLFAFFWGEHFIANRFYDHEQTPTE
ncbi:MAG: hypothetical protein R3C11_20840 [Planctomycetaceae bacterium]